MALIGAWASFVMFGALLVSTGEPPQKPPVLEEKEVEQRLQLFQQRQKEVEQQLEAIQRMRQQLENDPVRRPRHVPASVETRIPPAELAALGKQLDSARLSERNEASARLLAAGRTAIPVLLEAANGPSNEAASRAFDLLSKLYHSSNGRLTSEAAGEALQSLARSDKPRLASRAAAALQPAVFPAQHLQQEVPRRPQERFQNAKQRQFDTQQTKERLQEMRKRLEKQQRSLKRVQEGRE